MAGGSTSHPTDRLEGTAPAIVALRAQIRHLAGFDARGGRAPTLLLEGETGTGKGLVARIVHDSGPRARGSFIPVNCAAIPETMLEAELFGFEAGAFTDAKRAKAGLFEAASGGTLFLDEIDSLSLALQAKLLTTIESRQVRRLGAVSEHALDVKLVVATQRDLAQLSAAAGFRADLYHRLALVQLRLPPLRERGDDVRDLARAFLLRFAASYGVPAKRLTVDGEAWLAGHRWPGNVRQLSHLMERVTLLHSGAEVDRAALAALAGPPTESQPRSSATEPTEMDETRRILDALARAEGNVMRAARMLGVSRDTIRYRMRRHGIERPPRLTQSAPARPRQSGAARSRDVPAAERDDAPPPAGDGAPPPTGDNVTGGPEAPLRPGSPVEAWERKAVAVVAVELTWPEQAHPGLPSYEPWTEAARWERAIGEKLGGLGGVLLQRSSTLLVWAIGLPRALEQLPQRAVHGALAIRQMVTGLSGRERAPEMRVAVHLGAMLADGGATDPTARALAVGDTLALPLRLLAEAEAAEILVSAEVGRRVEGWVALEPVTIRARRGEQGEAYRVIRLSSSLERDPRRARRPLIRFVGRERERAAVEELLDAAVTGSGQALGIVGEPGVGKSRLLYEFRIGLAQRRIVYGEAHCLAHASMTPYVPIRELVRSGFDLAETDSVDALSTKIAARLARLGMDAESDTPYLLALCAPAARPDALLKLDAPAIKLRTFDVLRRMVAELSREQPLVLAVENAHWIDPSSEEFFASLVEALARVPCLLVMTYRPGYRPTWLAKSYAVQISLRPLGRGESRQIVREAAGATAIPLVLEDELLAKAEGNPFFLEELVRSVVEQSGGTTAAMIPRTIQAVLAARIDRLAPGAKHVLQTAAVIGREVPRSLLAAVADASPATLAESVGQLQEAEFIYETGRTPEAAYVFKHVLTQAVAHESLPGEARRALHTRVLEALEARKDDPRPDRLERLARHAVEGRAWDKGITYFERAGAAAARLTQPEAVACYEQALAALAHLPETDERRQRACDLHLSLGRLLHLLGEFQRALDMFRAAEAAARARGDDRRLAQVLGGMSYVLESQGHHPAAVEAGRQAIALSADPASRTWFTMNLARCHFSLGQYDRAIEDSRWMLDALGEVSPAEHLGWGSLLPSVTSRAWLALSLARTGEFPEAIARAEEAVQLAEADGAPRDRLWAYHTLGEVHHARGDFARAISWLERAVPLSERGAYPIYYPRVLALLGSSYHQAGRAQEGLVLLESSAAEAERIKLGFGYSRILVELGLAHAESGRPDEAARFAGRALARARAAGERGEEAWAIYLEGEIARARGEAGAQRAAERFHQARSLAGDLGLRPLAARCELALGLLQQGRGEATAARARLARAAASFRAMGMDAWLARAAGSE